jgi:hypothetical protein
VLRGTRFASRLPSCPPTAEGEHLRIVRGSVVVEKGLVFHQKRREQQGQREIEAGRRTGCQHNTKEWEEESQRYSTALHARMHA